MASTKETRPLSNQRRGPSAYAQRNAGISPVSQPDGKWPATLRRTQPSRVLLQERSSTAIRTRPQILRSWPRRLSRSPWHFPRHIEIASALQSDNSPGIERPHAAILDREANLQERGRAGYQPQSKRRLPSPRAGHCARPRPGRRGRQSVRWTGSYSPMRQAPTTRRPAGRVDPPRHTGECRGRRRQSHCSSRDSGRQPERTPGPTNSSQRPCAFDGSTTRRSANPAPSGARRRRPRARGAPSRYPAPGSWPR